MSKYYQILKVKNCDRKREKHLENKVTHAQIYYCSAVDGGRIKSHK